MVLRRRGVLVLGLAVGCGPDVAGVPGDSDATDTVGSGETAPPEDSTSGSTGGDSTGDGDTTGDGDPREPEPETLCWSSVLARGRGIERAWTDGERIVAAAQDSVIAFDGSRWHEVAVSDGAAQVDATGYDDAWVLGRNALLHWDGRTVESSFREEGATMRALAVAPDGSPWVAYTPVDDCIEFCREPASEVVQHAGFVTNLLPSPGFAARAMVFADDVAWIGGVGGAVARASGNGPWEPVATPFGGEVSRMWWVGGVVWVATDEELWRYADGAWTLSFTTAGFFDALTAVAAGPDGETLLLQSTHVVGALENTGELLRETGAGWESVQTFAADRELVVLDDGRAVAMGDEHGQLVQTISDLGGEASVQTELFRPDLGAIGSFSVTGDGTLVGTDPHGVAVETSGGWTRDYENSIYGWFRSAWGETADELWVVDADDDTAGALYRWSSGAFTPTTLFDPGPEPDTYYLSDVWGTAENRVFVAGWRDPYWLLEPDAPLVARFDGEVWTEIAAPPFSDNVHLRLTEIDGIGDEVWAVGDLVWRFDGRTWSDVTPEDALGFRSLVVSPLGTWVVTGDYFGEQRLLHHDGTAWIDETDGLPGFAPSKDVNAALTIAGSESDVWVAWRGATPGLARWDGAAWHAVDVPEPWPDLAAMIVAPRDRLVVHTGQRIWSGTACR